MAARETAWRSTGPRESRQSINGDKVAEGRIDRTQANIFSADEGTDVGLDAETPVTDDYEERDNKFTGKIGKITVELK
jgi:hypothetical protein